MAGDIEDAFRYIFTWETAHDDRVCPKCQALNGREYTDQDLFDHLLHDPEYGPIWDLDADRSLAHGYQQFGCRCQIAVCIIIDWSKVTNIYKLSQEGLAVAMYQRAPGTSIRELRQDMGALKQEIKDTDVQARHLQMILTNSLVMVKRLSGDERLDAAITKMQRFIGVVNTARATYRLLLLETGPIGLAILALTTISVSWSLAEEAGSYL